MVSGEHSALEKLSSTEPMLPQEKNHFPHVILPPANGSIGKILIREDTLLGSMHCAGCGKAKFKCGVGKQRAPTEKKYTCVIFALATIFLASLVGTILFCFTNILNNAVISNMVLSNNSTAFKMWQKPSIEPLMKVHIFNYTNVDAVRNGLETKLRVQDVGPFVYSQTVERVNTKFNKDGTLTFQEKTSFNFIPHLSEGLTQFDRVVVPNLPLISVVHKSRALPFYIQTTLEYGFKMLRNHKTAFIELAAHRFLWGYDDEIIDTARPILNFIGQMPFEKFGLLVTKNGTLPQKTTINTGAIDIDRLNFIERIDGQASLSNWGTAACNSLEATDGSIFPSSLLDRNTTLYIYKDNLCRRIPFVYEKDVKALDGILALRYVIPDNVFDYPPRNPDNQCYCDIDSGACPPRGIANVSACAFGTPAMASFPHFYLGDPALIKAIDGLHPDADLHRSFLDIHPTLGLPLNVRSGFQVNVQVPNTEFKFSELSFLKPGTVLPIAWIEATMGTIPQGIRTLVYHGTYSTAAVQLALMWGCGILLLISGVLLVIMCRRLRKQPCATVHIDSMNLSLHI